MNRRGMFSSNRSLLVLVACICFVIAVLETADSGHANLPVGGQRPPR